MTVKKKPAAKKKRRNPYRRNSYHNVKWHVLDDGKTKVQGTWERDYGNYLIQNNIEFVSQPKKPALYYIVPRTGGRHRYTPDFYLPAYDTYIEITPQFALDKAGGAKARKLRRVANDNPQITLKILTAVELQELGLLQDRKTKAKPTTKKKAAAKKKPAAETKNNKKKDS